VSGLVLLIGLGDLGRRLAERVAACPDVDELVLSGRRAEENQGFAHLLDSCGSAAVRFVELDASHPEVVAQVITRVRPDLVLHCACLLSPWHLIRRQDAVAATLSRAGFAVQLPAQLPLLMNVMAGVLAAGFAGPVVNCSYPDVTHPVLACQGRAPTLGVGNVGMIEARIRAAARRERPWPEAGVRLVRVLAHHAHVGPAMRLDASATGRCPPRVYMGEEGDRADDLAFTGPAIPAHPNLNLLTAAVALPVLRALLPDGAAIRTSAPGPLGLPGGYPVTVTAGRVELDLPPGTDLAEAIAFQGEAARFDGVDRIAEDGTVSFTTPVQQAVRHLDSLLGEPMHPAEAATRFTRLAAVLRR
jgi:hypothetical protein